MSYTLRAQWIVMLAFALGAGVLCAIYCRFASRYRNATNDLIAEFGLPATVTHHDRP